MVPQSLDNTRLLLLLIMDVVIIMRLASLATLRGADIAVHIIFLCEYGSPLLDCTSLSFVFVVAAHSTLS